MGKTLVEIAWKDAASEQEALVSDLRKPSEELVNQISYGRIIDEDDQAIIIAQTENDIDQTDYIVIPKSNVSYIIRYEKANRETKRSS